MSSRTRPLAFAATIVLGIPVAILLVWPQAFGAALAPGIAQLLSFRTVLALVLAVAAAIAATVAVLRRRWAIAAGLALVLGVAAIGGGAVQLVRGSTHASAGDDGDLTVLAWNTQGGASGPAEIARLVLSSGADIVSLPETDAAAAAEVVRLVEAGGRSMHADTTAGVGVYSDYPTSVLIGAELGEYRLDETAGSTPELPSGVWLPVSGSGPAIVAAHPFPPLPGHMPQWRDGLRWVAQRCAMPDVIVAGDLNATVDHLAGIGGDALIGGCDDAASQAGVTDGSWPATVMPALASPIDHVLFGSAWTARSFRVVTSTAPGSDHRAVIAVLGRA